MLARPLCAFRSRTARSIPAAVVLLIIVLLSLPGFARQTPQELVKQGDSYWAENSYELALEKYQQALAATPNLPNRPEIDYRIAVSLGRASKWDQAESAIEEYVKRYRDTIWEARGQIWRARLYVIIDHQGYRVGKRISRGRDVPASEGKNAPQGVDLSTEDAQLAHTALMRAKTLFDRFRTAHLDSQERARLAQEEIDLDFDLVNEITLRRETGRVEPGSVDWTLDTHQPFDARWPAPKQVMYLYTQIADLDAALPGADHHAAVLAALGEASYILQIRQNSRYYPQWVYVRGRYRRARQMQDRMPYLAIDPIELLRSTLRRYPNDREADRLAYTIALWTEQKGDASEAVTAYDAFLSSYPKSRWSSDASGHLSALLSPSLSLYSPGTTLPGQRAVIQFSSRNVQRVRFTAYRVHLEEIFGHVSYRTPGENTTYRPNFADFAHNFGADNGGLAYTREKVAEWTATTSDNGKHNLVNDTISTPLDSTGAYLVEARAGNRDQIRYSGLVIVSDLVAVEKVDRDSLLVYVAEAQSGKPVPNVKLTIWQSSLSYGSNGEGREARYFTGITTGEGTFRAALTPATLTSTGAALYPQAAVFAFAAPDRYAVTGPAGSWGADLSIQEQNYRAYVYCDRPLYRPAQTVRLRVVMTQGIPGSYRPAAGKQVSLLVNGPHGEMLHKTVTLGEFGSWNESLALPEGADPGAYQITVQRTEEQFQRTVDCGYGSFRVEEYKKPEFTVSVRPDQAQVRMGEMMHITISAHYYFGAPVANASVHYQVTRRPAWHPAPFHSRLDWYDASNTINYNPNYSGSGILPDNESARSYCAPNAANLGGGESGIYREGDLITDAQGEAHLDFPTAPRMPRGYRGGSPGDQEFVITADVVDDSRRQVSGAGSARATTAQFSASLQLDRAFLLPGDTLRVDIRTLDGSDRPFGAKGYVSFYRIIPAVPEQRRIDPRTGKEVIVVHYVPPSELLDGKRFVQTDAAQDGSGCVVWHPDTPADYRLQYDSTDAWGNTITATGSILVYGPGFDSGLNPNDGRCELRPEFPDYHPGETARVLLIAPVADSYALFTERAVDGIVRYRTVFVPGRSTLVDVSISYDHAPNAGLTATIVHAGQVSEANAEIGVPVEDRILKLAVLPDRPTYKPGEHAVFRLRALDADGRPVRAEISLGVVDDSLLAMEPDSTLDIRRFFYGYRLPTHVEGSISSGFRSEESRSQYETGYYEQHPLDFPEGMGWLRDHYPERFGASYIPEYVPYYAPSEQNAIDRIGPGIGGFPGAGGGYGGAGAMGGMRGEFVDIAGAPGPQGPQGPPGPVVETLSESGRATESATPEENVPTAPHVPPPAALAEARVRREFADTAYWMPAVVTDRNGEATVSFDFPDNITSWHITARGVTGKIEVGIEEAQAVTKKDLLVRLQAPRFFVDRDQVVLSANVHNYLDTTKTVRVELVTDSKIGLQVFRCSGVQVFRSSGVQEKPAPTLGKDVQSRAESGAIEPEYLNTRTPEHLNSAVRSVTLPQGGEARVDWTVDIKQAGRAKIKVVAQTDQESDAAEQEFPVLVHGVEKFVAQSGVMRDGGAATLDYDLPAQRRQGATLLDVQLSPSLASIMLDALPYLEDYPYGCIEQTTSRFVPAVLVAQALKSAGVDLETLGRRARELEAQRATIPPEQLVADSGYTYPKGIPGALDVQDLASRLRSSYHGRTADPIFDSQALDKMVAAGLQRLQQMQREDGSWGWWQGSQQGDPHLTAYVLESLLRAQQAGIKVDAGLLDRGYDYLHAHLNSTEELPELCYFVYVVSLRSNIETQSAATNNSDRGGPSVDAAGLRTTVDDADAKQMLTFLYERRDRLNAYGQSLLALALQKFGLNSQAQVMVRNLATTARRDDARGTVHWEPSDTGWTWRWYNDKQEMTAYALRALVAIAPQAQLAPQNGPQQAQTGLAPMAVRWLVDNRRGGYWTSTRQTAVVVEALLDYARLQHELTPDYTLTLDVDGRVKKSYHITAENALLFDNRFLVGDEALTSGAQHVNIAMQGKGTLYYSGYLKFFDLEEPIQGVANAIGVERKYYKIGVTFKSDRQGQIRREEERVPLADGAKLTSGDIVEVELNLKSDNDYDHLVFEDMKPAGCEAVETRSGEAYGDGLCADMELRDDKVAFFIDELPQGTRRITYRLRAEVPGAFHALPTNAYAMYAPDIRALSDEWRATISDR